MNELLSQISQFLNSPVSAGNDLTWLVVVIFMIIVWQIYEVYV